MERGSSKKYGSSKNNAFSHFEGSDISKEMCTTEYVTQSSCCSTMKILYVNTGTHVQGGK
jgi:hypothetical protein